MWMPKGLCGRTLSLDLGFLIPLSQTTDFSLIAKLSEGTVVNWVSRIGILLQFIPRGSVTNVKYLLPTFINQGALLVLCLVSGLLLSEAWTL